MVIGERGGAHIIYKESNGELAEDVVTGHFTKGPIPEPPEPQVYAARPLDDAGAAPQFAIPTSPGVIPPVPDPAPIEPEPAPPGPQTDRAKVARESQEVAIL